jgi:hypothetical protein
MALKSLLVIVGLAAVASVAAPPHARSQPAGPVTQSIEPSYPPPPAPPATSARQRIEIHPRTLLYRRCVDWYELQHRPSGTVLFPQMRCWWVRG